MPRNQEFFALEIISDDLRSSPQLDVLQQFKSPSIMLVFVVLLVDEGVVEREPEMSLVVFLVQHGLDPPDVIVSNSEGFELSALQILHKHARPVLLCGVDSDEILKAVKLVYYNVVVVLQQVAPSRFSVFVG